MSVRNTYSRCSSFFQTLLQPTEAPLPEYKTAAIEKSRFVLTHYGIFKTCWDWLILVATIYVAIMVPYNAAFRTRTVHSDSQPPVPDVVVEMLFIIGELLRAIHLVRYAKKSDFRTPKHYRISYLALQCPLMYTPTP